MKKVIDCVIYIIVAAAIYFAFHTAGDYFGGFDLFWYGWLGCGLWVFVREIIKIARE